MPRSLQEAGECLGPSERSRPSWKLPVEMKAHGPPSRDLEDQTAEATDVGGRGRQDCYEKCRGEHLREGSRARRECARVPAKARRSAIFDRDPNYSDSVSTLALLLQRYVVTYSRGRRRRGRAAGEDINTNPEADLALTKFWDFVTSLESDQGGMN